MVTYVSKLALPYFVRNSDLKLSGSCMSTFVKIFVDLRKLKLPAIKLLDAMAKPPYGLLHGTFSVMGDYDQCLEVSSTKKGDVPKNKKDEYYHGQYCTVEVEFPPKILEAIKDYNNKKINLTDFGKLGSFIGEFPGTNFAGKYFKYGIGICLPSTCSLQDLKEILKLIPVNFLPMDAKRCDDGSRKPLNTDQMVFLVVLLLIASFVVLGTVLDAYFYIRIPHYSGSHKSEFHSSFINNDLKGLVFQFHI
ncbi:uncharacterized protein LOC129218962 [Uloborus diversus]|uniref:uncharacterized protein LOC129218962 n=1 Tax=Uloborus diversus TaxID=327109 RepID=UPI0024093AC2|nr:uncharacterized protein LOC129218962 [Uloborus diversus]